MFCKKCGIQLKENAEFCHSCGAAVSRAVATESLPAEGTFQTAANNFYTESAADKTTAEEITEKKPKKKRKVLKVLIPVISVVLVAGIVAGAVFLHYYNSPVMKLSRAFENTFYDSSDINMTLTLDEAILSYKSADASITFGKGINGSRVNIKTESEKEFLNFLDSKTDITIENGIVYVAGKEKVVISEFIAEAKKSGDAEKMLLASFLETLDKAIDGKLDKEIINTFIQQELLTYGENSDAPDTETVEAALKEILKESINEEAITLEEKDVENGERYEINVDVNAVIDCMFNLSEEDENVNVLVQYLTACVSKVSDGKITDKESFRKYLNEAERLKNYDGFEFGVTVKDERITELDVPGAFKVEINSQK